MPVLLLGALASLFSLAAVVPQVRLALRTRDVEGVSWATAVLSLATFTLWVVYGFAVADGVQVVNNVTALVLLGALAFAVVRAGGAGRAAWAAPVAVLLSAALAVVTVDVFNSFVLAMTATVISSVRMLPQTRLALTGVPLTGLDPVGAALAWLGMLLWSSYGVLVGDLGVLLCSVIALAMQTAIVRARLFPAPSPAADAYGLAA